MSLLQQLLSCSSLRSWTTCKCWWTSTRSSLLLASWARLSDSLPAHLLRRRLWQRQGFANSHLASDIFVGEFSSLINCVLLIAWIESTKVTQDLLEYARKHLETPWKILEASKSPSWTFLAGRRGEAVWIVPRAPLQALAPLPSQLVLSNL